MAIEQQLQAALHKRRALGLPSQGTTAYRLVHGAGDQLEGLTVDVYNDFLVASLYTEQRGAQEDAWLTALAKLGFRGVYLKQRPRQANTLDETERKERAPEHALFGENAPDELVVLENHVPFAVRLGDGLSTGLFLDQRDNRARFAQLAPGKRVLNLFAYTCAFGVVAARAGAAATTNIDVAKNVLERGRHNYQLSTLAGDHRFLARDVLDTLPRLARREDRYDLIALDPPSYASTKGSRFSVERDYHKLAEAALTLLAPEGTLLACTNHARMSEQDLCRSLERAALSAHRAVQRIELCPPPADHPAPPGKPAHLKSAWVTLKR